MYLAYFDESGDDGFPKYSSKLFVLTSFYLHHQKWKENFELVKKLRAQLKKDFNFPVKTEFKARNFILNKNPYKRFNISDEKRKEMLKVISNFIPNLEIKFINVVIIKTKIERPDYNVFKNAVKYNIQRIENDLTSDPLNKFMIITDEGRVGKMRKTTRAIQKINVIPSKFTGTYRREIKLLVEDPLPKKSHHSYFVQLADFVAFVIYLYSVKEFIKENWSKRLNAVIDFSDITEILNNMKSNLNLKASPGNEYGIVYYPK